MENIMGIALIILLIILVYLLFILPARIVIKSDRLEHDKKTLWILIVLMYSWIGVIVFFMANPKQEKNN